MLKKLFNIESGAQIILDLYALKLFDFCQQLRIHSTLIVLVRQNADSERFLLHAKTLLRHLRRDRRKGAKYYHRSCEPFALLESCIRNNPLRRLAAPPLPKGEAFICLAELHYRLSRWESCQR